jgi:hypothetical protein
MVNIRCGQHNHSHYVMEVCKKKKYEELAYVDIFIQYWSIDGEYIIYLTRLRNEVKDER